MKLQNPTTSLTSRTLFTQWLLTIQTLGLVVVFAAIMVHGYQGRHWTAVQSFQIAYSWCKQGQEGLGSHCFGDFGLPYNRGLQEFVYSPDNYAAANTPLTAAIFEILRLVPYNYALVLYMLAVLASIAIPFLLYLRTVNLTTRLQLMVLTGAVTSGAIAAIDRGNHVVLIVPLLVGYLLAIKNEQWRRASFFLVLIAMLKFWGIIFVVALIARKQFAKSLAVAVSASTASLAILLTFPQSLGASLSGMLSMAGNRDYANSVAGFAISIQGLLRRIDCLFSDQEWCNSKLSGGALLSSTLISLLVAVLLTLIALILCASKGVPPHISTAAVVSLGFLAVPEAPVYNLVLTTALVVVVVAQKEANIPQGWMASSVALLAAVSVSTLPVTLYSNGLSQWASGSGEGLPVFRSDFWLVPLSWIVFISLAIFDFWRSRSLQDEQQ